MKLQRFCAIGLTAACIFAAASCANTRQGEIQYKEQDVSVEYTNLEASLIGSADKIHVYSTNSKEYPFALYYDNMAVGTGTTTGATSTTTVKGKANAQYISRFIFLRDSEIADVAAKLEQLLAQDAKESKTDVLLRKVRVEDERNGLLFQRATVSGSSVYNVITLRYRAVNVGTNYVPVWEYVYGETGTYAIKANKLEELVSIIKSATSGTPAPKSEPSEE